MGMVKILVLVLFLGSLANAASNELSVKQSNVVGVSVKKEWNARLFPMNAWANQVHLALERSINPKWAIGVEGAYGSGYNYFLADGYTHFRESYVGPYVQYYLRKTPSGFFAEVGLNLAFVDAQYDQRPLSAKPSENYPELTYYKSTTFLMPHLTANYRSPLFWGGFNANAGLGVFSYVGEGINFSEAENPRDAGAYSNSRLLPRVRLDVGYAF